MLTDIIAIASRWKIGTFLGASEVDAVGYLIAEIANLQAENERLKSGIAKYAESVGIRPVAERQESREGNHERRSSPQIETHLSLTSLPMRLQAELASLERQHAEAPIDSIDRSALGILLPKLQELTRLTKFVLGETQPAEHSLPSPPPVDRPESDASQSESKPLEPLDPPATGAVRRSEWLHSQLKP